MTNLEKRRVLLRFICREFGYEDIRSMLERLCSVSAGFGPGSESECSRALFAFSNHAFAKVPQEQFGKYDANIAAHSHRLRMTSERGRAWKPHQYLALLFTEHYLYRYFTDSEKLRIDMNNAKRQNRTLRAMPDYTPEDLRTIAFQSATGSGKTLIMHAHILQYRHWMKKSGGRLNNIILVTPNEQMSLQHERELRESGVAARLFSGAVETNLLRDAEVIVEIIDLNKLAEKKGVKRVAVSDFGENNLLLVDEGHLGASGNAWRKHREELAKGGFTFEYSATFNQVVKNAKDLLNTYGKCLLFDYSYRNFYEDGYGKDYTISNLPKGVEDASSNLYLLGSLLTFYRQCRTWQDKGSTWVDFNLTKPLWIFLGKTVVGTSRVDKQARTDVVCILEFLGWVLAHDEEVQRMLKRLLNGESGLVDEAGNDYFAGRFDDLRDNQVDNLYAHICELLFHGYGKLHVRYLTTGEGELHLRTQDNETFGVVNVGDSKSLYDMLVKNANPDFVIEREVGFVEKLFARVDHPHSTVNIVIGARRFIAGWNSWRVSTMGLMHVGVGEGPEIIQMFGRGVRLKGWNMSLKRHLKSGGPVPADSNKLAELETLYIFGLRANYMQTFRNLLQEEGIRTKQETVSLPVTWNFASNAGLKMIRLDGESRYEYSDERVALPGPESSNQPVVKMDLYSRLESISSDDTATGESVDKKQFRLTQAHIAFFNRKRIYEKLLVRKRQNKWYNLTIEPAIMEQLLLDDKWYKLYMPQEQLEAKSFEFEGLRKLENIATDLLTEYAEQFWRKQRRHWEQGKIKVVLLDEDDPNNIKQYQLSVDATKMELVEGVHKFSECPECPPAIALKITAINSAAHAYKPLLHKAQDSELTIRPVALDDNEKEVVNRLIALTTKNGESSLQGRELFLIRNLSRGQGVSFFSDYTYYPDFIIWLKKDDEQHVIFLDPKGLVIYGRKERKKIRLHTKIKKIERQVKETNLKLRLHAYVISVTPPDKISDKFRSKDKWAEKGVYFLEDSDCIEQIITKVLKESSVDYQVSSD